jgi:hypothetical protein
MKGVVDLRGFPSERSDVVALMVLSTSDDDEPSDRGMGGANRRIQPTSAPSSRSGQGRSRRERAIR